MNETISRRIYDKSWKLECDKLRARVEELEKERAYLDTKFRQLVNCIGLQTYVSENERLEKERDEIQSVANQLQKAFITEERENGILEQRNATLVEALERISQHNPHTQYCGTCSHFKLLAEQALSSASPTSSETSTENINSYSQDVCKSAVRAEKTSSGEYIRHVCGNCLNFTLRTPCELPHTDSLFCLEHALCYWAPKEVKA